MGGYDSCLPPDLTVYDQLVPPHVPQSDSIKALRLSFPKPSLALALYNHLNKPPRSAFSASCLGLPCITFPITQLSALRLDLVTKLHVYRATTSGLGEVEIQTRGELSRMKDLLLIHPWIGPILDQEYSHGTGAFDEMTCALRLIARLRQPFSALLLKPVARARYRRVAADCLIMVQVCEETSLTELIEGIRTTIDIQ